MYRKLRDASTKARHAFRKLRNFTDKAARRSMITVLLDILEHAAPPPVPNEVRTGGREEGRKSHIRCYYHIGYNTITPPITPPVTAPNAPPTPLELPVTQEGDNEANEAVQLQY